MPTLLLVHSPFLGPATWRPVAERLVAQGCTVRVPDLTVVATAGAPFWPAGVAAVVGAAGPEPVVLVVHSNAGLYVPAIVRELGDAGVRVDAVVHVDAALAGRGHRTTPEFLARLVGDDGLLPPWTSWWDEADVAPLFPDAAVRAEVEAEAPSMPLAYYDVLPPVPDGWIPPPVGYLWFGPPYDQEAAQVAASGRPVVHLPGRHLHMLVDPDAVAAAILELARKAVLAP